MKNTKGIPVNETPEQKRNRETTESIAQNIKALAETVSALLKGPLNRKALLILLANSSGMPKGHVEAVLVAVENLGKDWLK